MGSHDAMKHKQLLDLSSWRAWGWPYKVETCRPDKIYYFCIQIKCCVVDWRVVFIWFIWTTFMSAFSSFVPCHVIMIHIFMLIGLPNAKYKLLSELWQGRKKWFLIVLHLASYPSFYTEKTIINYVLLEPHSSLISIMVFEVSPSSLLTIKCHRLSGAV